METQKCENFSKSSKLTKLNSVRTPSFRMPRKKSPCLRQYQSYISNWYVNGKVFTSTTTWEPKNLIFFFKKFEIEFDLYFDLCWRTEIIQVGLNMHLYVDIGDASSSLWGSTSSCNMKLSLSYWWLLYSKILMAVLLCKMHTIIIVLNIVFLDSFVLVKRHGSSHKSTILFTFLFYLVHFIFTLLVQA